MVNFPHFCDTESPSHSTPALGLGWEKPLLLSLESLPGSWVLARGLQNFYLKLKPSLDTVLHM